MQEGAQLEMRVRSRQRSDHRGRSLAGRIYYRLANSGLALFLTCNFGDFLHLLNRDWIGGDKAGDEETR